MAKQYTFEVYLHERGKRTYVATQRVKAENATEAKAKVSKMKLTYGSVRIYPGKVVKMTY